MQAIQKIEQKKVLSIACLIEMGERYVFYIIQSLLVLYLIDQLHLPHAYSTKLAGTVFGMVYISALLGGYIAERLLNYYVATFIGSLLLIVGCLFMTNVHSQNTLFFGLALISISSGLIKSNVSAFIGKFYDRIGALESERDFGFNIFYMGINTGILFATFFAVYLRNTIGFGPTFYISSAVSAVLSTAVIAGFFILKKELDKAPLSFKKYVYSAAAIIIYIACVFFILKNPHIANMVFILAALICATILFISARKNHLKQVIASLIFFTLSVLYWSLYMQLFISLLLFIHFCVHHHLLGFPINTSQFISVESIFVITMGIAVGKLWIYLENKNRPVQDIDKFNVSFLLIGILFCLLYVSVSITPLSEKISAWPVIVGVFFMAISELTLSAIGLSMVTKIAPKGYVSLYMGIWLVTLGLGSKLAGQLSSFIIVNKNIAESKIAMTHGLLWFMGLCAAGIIIACATRRFAIITTS